MKGADNLCRRSVLANRGLFPSANGFARVAWRVYR